MKKIRKILLWVCLFVFIAGGSQIVMADETVGYEIENYHTDITVMENNSIFVHERLDVNFTEARHGIIRFIPEKFVYRGEDDKVYAYKTKVTDISVADDRYTVDTEDGCRKIQIGDEDTTITGPKTYTISYTIDMGSDRIEDYDMLYYDMLGADMDCKVKKVDFSISFEKEADMEKIQFYCGQAGSTSADGVTYEIKDGKVIGGTTRELKPGEALTVFLKLPADYFSGVRTYKPFLMMGSIIVLLAATAAAWGLFMKTRGQRHVVPTVEFYPPEGMTSAEVGYIIDGRANEEDILSLFIWLADQGYVRITGEGQDMTFTKVKDLEKIVPHYLKVFYRGMFKRRVSVTMRELTQDFYDSYESARTCLHDYFSGKRRLSDSRVTLASFGLICLSAAAEFLALLGCGGTVDDRLALYALLAFVVLTGGGLLLNAMWHQHVFGKRSHMVAVYVVLTVLYSIFAILFMVRNTFFGSLFPLMIFLTGYAAVLIAAATYKFTDYKIDMSGKLLGLRNFIETAELDRLQMLVEENPEYFYQVLPYAYVFGLTDKWIRQFESIAVEPPLWYGGYDYRVQPFVLHHMVHDLQNGCKSGIRAMNEEHAAKMAESSGGGIGSSGGGFSGGGAGGGGTSSW
ncbi:MAG: DUF2207 domain-containing protein [Lachnospiraceae bacterium]|jgi:uncharacterized membrane protein YgcG